MKKIIPIALVALVAALAINISTASAAPVANTATNVANTAINAHQDHRGACARSTKSINKGVGDLAYNGAATKVAKFFGIKPVNGSITKQLKDSLVIGRVAKSTKTKNHGCDGHGKVFRAGKRQLRKNETVAVMPPASIGKDACSRPSSRCTAFIIKVHIVLPWSCWNPNTGTILVKIWIKKDKVPKPPIKPPKVVPPPPGSGCTVIVNGDNNGNAGCGNLQICVANGNYSSDMTLCSAYANCIAIQGNTWNSTQNVCVTGPPPPPPTPTNPAPVPVCYGSKAHLQQYGDDYLFCEVIVPSGATTITGEMLMKLPGSTADSSVSGLEPWARWDDTPNNPSPCPANTKCYRAHLWAGAQTGWLNLRFTVTAIFPTGSNQPGSTDVAVPIRDQAPF